MSSQVKTRLRPLRRGWNLSQEDLALLLPGAGRNRIANLESGKSGASAEELMAFGFIFGLSAHSFFPHLYEETAETVMQGAYKLHQKYGHLTTPQARRKLQLLEQIKGRAIASTNQDDL